MIEFSNRPLYVAAYAIGGISTLVGAVTIVSDLQATGIPRGGSAITFLVGVTILALAVTGPSDRAEGGEGTPGEAVGPERGEPADEEARPGRADEEAS